MTAPACIECKQPTSEACAACHAPLCPLCAYEYAGGYLCPTFQCGERDPQPELRPVWRPLAMHDRSLRRGLWYRCEGDPERPTEIGLRAGREGDDAKALLRVGDVLDDRAMAALANVLHYTEAALGGGHTPELREALLQIYLYQNGGPKK